MKKLLIVLVLLISTSVFSQEAEIDLTIHKIEGKEYYIHVVEPGNTLFAISRRYAIPKDEIVKANPRLNETLTIGDRLLIPLNKIRKKDLDESPDIDGNYLIHKVQKKNTLYSLAKEYNIEINDIIVQNPGVEDGLKKGMEIKIPVAKIKSESNEEEYVIPAAASPYKTHTVLAKETLYSLSKLYNVTDDSIKQVNNGLVGGLKVGQLINLPILKSYKKLENDSIHFDSSAIKPAYKIALLLPFYLDLMDQVSDTSYNESEKLIKNLYDDAKYAIEFYQGFKLATDSLTNMGLNISLHIYDTGNDSAKVDSILADEWMMSADLIVGPLYLDNFLMVADFAKRNEINIVSPVKLSNRVLLGNNFVSKVVTSAPILTKFLGKYMYDSLRFKNMIMVYPDNFDERRKADLVKRQFHLTAESASDTNRISTLKEVFWNPKAMYGLTSKFREEEENVIIVPSEDKAFVTRLLTQLNLQDEFKFKVIGLAAWENFDNIEISYLQNLNVHLVVSEFIDYDSKQVVDFQKEFYEEYSIIPEKYSYLGFDVACYYLSLLNESGTNFESMFPLFDKELLGRKFNFIKTGIESGYENNSAYLIRYQNFKKIRLF